MSVELTGRDLIVTARAIATAAHDGQTDKAGEDYITHPARVAARVEAAGGDAEAIAAAWLHDVLEDSPTTTDQLTRAGIPAAVVTAVDALTRRRGESHEQAVLRAAADPIARLVKRADVADNADPTRLARLDHPTRERLTRKYAHAAALLAG